MGVILVNGFTDAPNSISGIVSSGILSVRRGCILGGVFNFFGVLISSLVGGRVAKSVLSFADFGEYGTAGVCASLITVIAFGVVAWAFAMPSSESHALISAIYGASLALNVGGGVHFAKIMLYMLASSLVCVPFALICARKLKISGRTCMKLEICAALSSSFMHGAQDGQKFIALLMLLVLNKDKGYTATPLVFVITVAILMLMGTMSGGGKIIDSLGNGIVKNSEKIAFVSDFCTTVCVFLCSVFGFPVSTGNIKACSLIGAGLGEGSKINLSTVGKIILTSAITFPICIGLGYLFTLLFIRLF